ncbi:LysM peptidoglycan-binding domain-containing protein [Trinickia terrae]|uniref:LysM peptidoglycan-binding domain-containing protein n=1 Tax=Trinickia terrae TaxID=2571161 RepID=A0A4U1IFK2_9BURK|nr:peptidoglycan DD-metalloendopeptidase family protein [Trinickia terrae]TKC92526.1 LysM peptidoglycan-binding domain-containing protein [Trinickia terrae]
MSRRHFDRSMALMASAAIAAFMAGCATVAPPVSSDTVAGAVPASAVQAAQAGQGASAGSADTSSAPASDEAVQVQWTRYVVKRGDTLASIARSQGCTVKNLIAWNHLKRKTHLVKGESLRIASRSGGNGGAVTAQTLDRHTGRVVLAWPADGSVIEPFEPGHNRGIQIGGNEGDPVRAAADGRVMYAGTGLNGYGSLIIVQHNADFLTAYSHSRKLLVKTGDVVKQGEEIAEMGKVDSPRVAVLFEVRRDGKPVDPMPYLPSGHG